MFRVNGHRSFGPSTLTLAQLTRNKRDTDKQQLGFRFLILL